jgi:hypothetical protein
VNQPVQPGFSPAGRLFRLLQQGMGRDGNKPTLEAWAGILGMDPGDKAAVYGAIGDVISLISDARAHVRRHPELKQELYLRTLDTVESLLLNQSPMGQWGSIVSGLNGPHMLALEFCAEQMDRLAEEKELPEAILDSLRTDIDAALTRLLSSDLEDIVKQHLVQRLEEVRAAILSYRVSGIAVVARTTEASLGAAVVAQSHARGEGNRAAIKDYLDIVQKGLNVVERAAAHYPLLASAVRALAGLLHKGS